MDEWVSCLSDSDAASCHDAEARESGRRMLFKTLSARERGCEEVVREQAAFLCDALVPSDIDSIGQQDYNELCALLNCSKLHCDLGQQGCTDSLVECSKKYLICAKLGSNFSAESARRTQCACAKSFYYCIEERGCTDVPLVLEHHASLCSESNCSMQECGLRSDVSTCQTQNGSKLECTEAFLQCAESRRLPPSQDRCAIAYNRSMSSADSHSQTEARLCSDPFFGGSRGCVFDTFSKECFLSGECSCSTNYLACIHYGCENSPQIADMIQACRDAGCDASECGMPEQECDEAEETMSLKCAQDFLQCEELGPCSVSECMQTYYGCMRDSKCQVLSLGDRQQHLQLCSESGCSPWECGVATSVLPVSSLSEQLRLLHSNSSAYNSSSELPPSVLFLPDAAVNLRLVGASDLSLKVSWSNSPLANYWSRVRAPGRVLYYVIELQECSGGGASECGRIIANATVSVGFANQAQFRSLDEDVNYRVTVWAWNRFGRGPSSASITHLVSREPCGDGLLTDGEQCDDANDRPGDGCESCIILQPEWACWGTPSICCGPCAAGQYLVLCGLMLPEHPLTTGVCVACEAGKYKNASGAWDSICVECPDGKYALDEGNEACVAAAACAPGFELVGMSSSAAGSCVACPFGKYKNEDMTSCARQKALLPCPAGNFRTPTPGSNPSKSAPSYVLCATAQYT